MSNLSVAMQSSPAPTVAEYLSAASFWMPEDLVTSAWLGHSPFAFWLVGELRPGRIVELGTHSGFSYFAFCQAVRRLGLSTECFAVDTWQGDPHAGFYGEDVYAAVSAVNSRKYADFSRLCRSTFAEAARHFADGSIDLLHIDGGHRYEDVLDDFTTWLPKMSNSGVVLLHDTNVRERDFGVWKFWGEISARFPSFEFFHEHGLGVIAVGSIPGALAGLFSDDPREQSRLREAYARLGRAVSTESEIAKQEQALREHRKVIEQMDADRRHIATELAQKTDELRQVRAELSQSRTQRTESERRLKQELHNLNAAVADANRQRAEVGERLQLIEGSTTWRATSTLRASLARAPEPVRLNLRRVAKGIWWIATPHRMPERVRFLRSRRPAPAIARLPARAIRRSDLDAADSRAARTESVDVIVCVHNALDDVRRCLESVVRCTLPPYRLILVNDGSGEETTEYLAAFARDQGATLLRNETARGYTFAANAGLRASDSPWVVLLNSDTIATEGWFDAMWRHASADPSIGAIGPLSNTASWQSAPRLFDGKDWATNPLPPNMTIQDMGDLVAEVGRGAHEMPFLNGFCYVIRRSAIAKVGLFDEETFGAGYGEENDYSIRLRNAGFRLAVASDAYVYHAQSKSYSTERRLALAQKADAALAAKHDTNRDILPQVSRCKNDLAVVSMRARVAGRLRQREICAVGRRHFEGRRIAIVLPIGEFGGGANVILQEARALIAMGVDVTIVNFQSELDKLERIGPIEGIPVLGMSGLAQLQTYLAENQGRNDAVIATLYNSVQWLPSQPPVGCTYGYYIQDFEPLFFRKSDPDHAIALNSYVSRDDLTLFTKTLWNQSAVLEGTGRRPAVVGCSGAVDLFYPADRHPAEAVQIRIAAMVRPATPRRAPERALAVLDELNKRFGGRIEILTFGADDAELKGKGLARRWIKNHGKLTQAQLATLLGATDIFIDCSDYQAMGLTLLEAMISGCAVVGPESGGAKAFVRDGVNGFLVDSTSTTELVERAEKLIQDAELRGRIQRRAIEDANMQLPEAVAYNILTTLFDNG